MNRELQRRLRVRVSELTSIESDIKQLRNKVGHLKVKFNNIVSHMERDIDELDEAAND
jgi:molecular chaperone GrpE (heat shock protein)